MYGPCSTEGGTCMMLHWNFGLPTLPQWSEGIISGFLSRKINLFIFICSTIFLLFPCEGINGFLVAVVEALQKKKGNYVKEACTSKYINCVVRASITKTMVQHFGLHALMQVFPFTWFWNICQNFTAASCTYLLYLLHSITAHYQCK